MIHMLVMNVGENSLGDTMPDNESDNEIDQKIKKLVHETRWNIRINLLTWYASCLVMFILLFANAYIRHLSGFCVSAVFFTISIFRIKAIRQDLKTLDITFKDFK